VFSWSPKSIWPGTPEWDEAFADVRRPPVDGRDQPGHDGDEALRRRPGLRPSVKAPEGDAGDGANNGVAEALVRPARPAGAQAVDQFAFEAADWSASGPAVFAPLAALEPWGSA
jgi:hypothetical protein